MTETELQADDGDVAISKPTKTVGNGRAADGRFTHGNRGGPGRPRGLDFRRVVAEQAEVHGVDVEAALWRVFAELLRKAENGDVQAARLLLDRLCGTKVQVEHSAKMTLEELVAASWKAE